MRVCVSDYVTKRLVASGRGEGQGLARGWRGEGGQEWQEGARSPWVRSSPHPNVLLCISDASLFILCICISAGNLRTIERVLSFE